MSRFYIEKENISGKTITIQGSDVNHIQKVLRKQPGDTLRLCDATDRQYDVKIVSMNPEQIVTAIESQSVSDILPKIRITVMQCLPKGDKMVSIVRPCVELGIDRVIPVVSDRCIAKANLNKWNRWCNVAKEAAKQCRRGRPPVIERPMAFADALVQTQNHDGKVICYENETKRGLKEVLDGNSLQEKSIAVLIGPEGGFTKDEVKHALREGFFSVSLGARILRTETVAPAICAILLYCTGDI